VIADVSGEAVPSKSSACGACALEPAAVVVLVLATVAVIAVEL
jgi:hypothetical protein